MENTQIKECHVCNRENTANTTYCVGCGTTLAVSEDEGNINTSAIDNTLDEKTSKDETKQYIEIQETGSNVKKFDDYQLLCDEILRGTYLKDTSARIITIAEQDKKAENNKKERNEEPKEIEWSTLEKISHVDIRLESLYRPIWAYTKKWMVYGIIAMIALKALDTTVLFFQIDEGLGFIWLLLIGSLFVSQKWWWAPGIPLILYFTLGFKGNLFFTIFAVAIVGVIFGAPLGMAIGTIIGHIKSGKIKMAPDTVSEGSRPYLLGLLAPVIFLIIATLLYIFWLMPMVLGWLK